MSGDFGPGPDGTTGRGRPRSTSRPRRSKPKAAGSATVIGGRKRRRWVRRTVIGTSVVVVLALLLGGAGWFYLNYTFGHIQKVTVKGEQKEAPGAPINIMLVGSDSRSCVASNPTAKSHVDNGVPVTGQRSDVLIVLRLVPADRRAEMLSIPRDTYVPIAGTNTENRINAAFNTGPSQLVETVEQDFHIPINHYVAVNFCGFTNAVQALGGVYLDFPDRVKDIETGLRITHTGCQFLNGLRSLQLVRSRDLWYYTDGQWNYDGLGDLSRIRRQQAFFHAVIKRADSEHNPLSLNSFLQDAVRNVQVDSLFSTGEIESLAIQFRGVASAALSTQVLPTSGAVYDGADVLLPVQKDDTPMIRGFLAFGTKSSAKPGTSSSTSSTSSSSTTSTSTTTTTSLAVTGTTTVPIIDTSKNYPEPWDPAPC
jgi:LCP family protein required for cell wall assembly